MGGHYLVSLITRQVDDQSLDSYMMTLVEGHSLVSLMMTSGLSVSGQSYNDMNGWLISSCLIMTDGWSFCGHSYDDNSGQ